MSIFLTILAFVVVLGVLVLVHEIGHFVMAKRAGVQVDEFGIGYPPRLFGKKIGDTLYSINAIPVGGFVRIASLEGGAVTEGPSNTTDSSQAKGELFSEKSFLVKFSILFAGIAMNIILAIVLFFVVFMIGSSQDPNEANSGAVITNQHIVIAGVGTNTPAERAGIEPGDEVVTINGNSVTTNEQLQSIMQQFENESLNIVVGRAEEQYTVEITPTTLQASDGSEYIGIGIGLQEVATIRYPVHIAFWEAIKTTGNLFIAIIVSLAELIGGIFTGTADTSGIAGPVGIAALTGEVARTGVVQLLQFSAILSVNLAIFNLLPIPALDGGRLLFVVIERIRGKEVDQRIESAIHQIGFMLLLLLVLVVTLRDIANIW